MDFEMCWTNDDDDPVHLIPLDRDSDNFTLCRKSVAEIGDSWREVAIYGLCGNCLYVVEAMADNYDDCPGCLECRPGQLHRCHVTGIHNQCLLN